MIGSDLFIPWLVDVSFFSLRKQQRKQGSKRGSEEEERRDRRNYRRKEGQKKIKEGKE